MQMSRRLLRYQSFRHTVVKKCCHCRDAGHNSIDKVSDKTLFWGTKSEISIDGYMKTRSQSICVKVVLQTHKHLSVVTKLFWLNIIALLRAIFPLRRHDASFLFWGLIQQTLLPLVTLCVSVTISSCVGSAQQVPQVTATLGRICVVA